MRTFYTMVLIVAVGLGWSATQAQEAQPEMLSEDQLKSLEKFEDQRIEIGVFARHVGSERVFMVGKTVGREIPVLILNASVDTANLGEALIVTGTVRRFDPQAFARDYATFKSGDYPNIHIGDLVIVASALRNFEGAQVPAEAARPAKP